MKNYVAAVKAAEGEYFARYAPALGPDHFDGLLLCGGGDIDPALFQQPDSGLNRDVDHRRERSDLTLIPAFIAQRKPVFGICRGMQMLNVALGGTLAQDLGQGCGTHEGTQRGDRFHPVSAASGSSLEQLYGPRFPVNSCHHQAVNAPAPGFRITCRADDGTVEGMEHESLPLFGVQWHPERLCLEFRREDASDGLKLFCLFVQLCGRVRWRGGA